MELTTTEQTLRLLLADRAYRLAGDMLRDRIAHMHPGERAEHLTHERVMEVVPEAFARLAKVAEVMVAAPIVSTPAARE